ncbi:HDOD domain-containing protein [Trichlorobacter lovleyi]|uniref:HDOD domain-containing protein n=1 Tax=Trichlorobacter lovleyi TaxID=313985 RepID=UPI0023EF6728|nr:HDOD domain-containing protein [Trichlorobacter lovleyi]
MGFSLDLRYQICLQPIELPVFNPVALELLQLLADPTVEIDHVTEIIQKDQGLAIQVLRMANSSAYVGRNRSETIKDAVNRLGGKQITSLAMAASQAALHASENPVVNEVMRHLWLHSHACALGCRSLAISSGHRALADQAYLAGLLHDIGKLYLLKAMERISLSREISFELDLETLLDVFSDMHVEQGVRIMNHWDIPPLYCAIAAHHHAETFDPGDTLLAIVRLVNFNSMQYNLNLYPRLVQPPDALPEISLLKVGDPELVKLEADMQVVCA